MIAVLKQGTTPEQAEHLMNWLKHMNLEVHVSQGKEFMIFGLVGDTSRVDIELLKSLEKYKEAILADDADTLIALLDEGNRCKEEVDG